MFSVVFLGPIANAKLLPQIQVAIHASQSALPTLSKNFLNLSRNQIQPKCSNSYAAYSQQSTSNYPTFYTSQRSYLAYILLLPEGRAGNAWKNLEQYIF
jgi:hypothetical protein